MSVIPDEVRELLTGANYAHLATVMPDGAPHSVAVWVDLEGDRILLGTQACSRKARNLDRDPRVALSLTDHDDRYRTAHLRGRVVDRFAGESAQAARRYAGRDFPKLAATVVYAARSRRAGHMKLPFAHRG